MYQELQKYLPTDIINYVISPYTGDYEIIYDNKNYKKVKEYDFNYIKGAHYNTDCYRYIKPGYNVTNDVYYLIGDSKMHKLCLEQQVLCRAREYREFASNRFKNISPKLLNIVLYNFAFL